MTPVHHGVQVGACEYKIMSTLRIFSSSLLTLRYWVQDSACTFPFTFNSLITTFSNFILAHWHFRLFCFFIDN
jgi:hypothetical protein